MKTLKTLIAGFLLCLFSSCTDYLDLKPDKKLTVPDQLKDLRALLDNPERNNFGILAETMADNYFLLENTWASMSQIGARNSYIWEGTPEDDSGWSPLYRHIYNMNVVLEQLERMDDDSEEWYYVKGTALFLRSYAFYELAQIFTKPYKTNAADDELGLPLRTSSDIERIFPRASLDETYHRIQSDLKLAVALLPEYTTFPSRPNRAAAYGMLARVNLVMGEFDEALEFGRSCIALETNDLLDYSRLESGAATPIPLFNTEVVFHAQQAGVALAPSRARVDTLLYALYDDGDIRKDMFFSENTDGSKRFKGNYTQNVNYLFSGISLSEVYLINAECEARIGSLDEAARWLNSLLIRRWRNDELIPVTFESRSDAMEVILLERRKELAFRNRRWEDLRRLNLEEQFQQTLYRRFQDVWYSLGPNDPRYVLYIPDEAVDFSGIPQNDR